MRKYLYFFIAVIVFSITSCKKNKPASTTTPPVIDTLAIIPSPQTPTLPAQPVIPNTVYNVLNYGAVPNDGIDDRANIQTAIDALISAGGGTLQFSAGTYNLTINPASGTFKYAISLGTGKIRLAAEPGADVTIKLNDGQGAYYTMFNAQSTNDVSIENLKFDQNGLNNQITLPEISGGDGGAVEQVSVRQIFAFSGAQRFKVDGCTFDNVMGVWVIFNSTGADGTITNNVCKNVGGANYDYDVSVIYTDCDRALVKNNTISGRSIGAKGARTAFEIHGEDQTVTNNTINSMLVGINIVGADNKTGITSVHRQAYTGNTMINVYNGFEFWTYDTLTDVLIQSNNVTINVDDFFYAGLPAFSAGKYAAPFGIGIKDWGQGVTTLKVADNKITFTNFTKNLEEIEFAASTYAAGISFATTNTTTIPITNLICKGNTITDALSAGFYSFITINNALVDSNTLNNPGRASAYSGVARYTDTFWDPYTAEYQSGVFVKSKQGSTVSSFTISNNITVNNLNPDVVKFGANAQATTGNSKCFLKANTVSGANAAVAQSKGFGWN